MKWRYGFRAGLVLVLFAYVVARGAQRSNDFKYPYNAARAFWQTGRLHVWAQPRYPVTFHVLLAPLAALPIRRAAAVWALLSFAAVASLPGLMERLSGVSPRGQVWSWAVVVPCLIDALVLGQSDPINLALVAAGALAAREGRRASGVGLIGLAGMIKILPALHWATIAALGRSRRAWAGMLLTTAAALGLVVAAAGWSQAWSGLREQADWIANHEKPWHLVARGSDLRVNNESLPIVLARTLGDLGRPAPRHAVALGLLPLETIWAMWALVLVALVGCWIACARACRSVQPGRAWLGMFALSSVVMLAASPICWHHYFLWLLPATVYLADRRRVLQAAAVLSALGTAIPAARGLGLHLALGLTLFVLVAADLQRRSRSSRPGATGRLPAPHFAAGASDDPAFDGAGADSGSNSTTK